jgi:hypothetical protein
VQSDLSREAIRFRPLAAVRQMRLALLPFSVAAIVGIAAISPSARAQVQNQTQQTTPDTSSSSQPTQTLESRRSLATRRMQTRMRREAAAVTETYTKRWDVYLGGEYMRFRVGPHLHNSGVGGWTFGLTRYFTPRFGITADARGMYGTNSLGPNSSGGYNTYNASFSVFPFTIGPQYRFYGSSKWSVTGAVQVGAIYGYFDADTNGIPPQNVGFYPASIVGAAITSLNIDYNLSPALAVRIAPDAVLDHFGGNFDHNQGFLMGLVYRLGHQ